MNNTPLQQSGERRYLHSKTPSPQPQIGTAHLGLLNPLRILLVSSCITTKQIILRALHQLDYDAHCVLGRTGLKSMAHKSFDAILIDSTLLREKDSLLQQVREDYDPLTQPILVAVVFDTICTNRCEEMPAEVDLRLHVPVELNDLTALLAARSAKSPPNPFAKGRHAIDISVLQAIADDDENLLNELIELFLQDSQRHLANLNAAFESRHSDKIRYTAQGLLGSASCIGANRLSELCRHIVTNAKKQNLAAVDELYKQVQAEYKNIHAYMRAMLP